MKFSKVKNLRKRRANIILLVSSVCLEIQERLCMYVQIVARVRDIQVHVHTQQQQQKQNQE